VSTLIVCLRPLLVTLLGLVATATGAAAQPSGESRVPEDGMTLDVMTFNIRTAEGRDGDDAWPFRKQLVVETIRQALPDVLGLQEVLAEQTQYLESELPEYRWLGVDRGLNGGTGLSEATPIFYRYDELVPIESGTFWLGDEPRRSSGRRRGSRIVTWARFHHLATAQQVYVFNTHLSLRGGRGQVDAIQRIGERIAGLPEGSAVIVMGDFNAVAGSSEAWQAAMSQGLRDTWRIASERHGPAVTSNGFGPPPDEWEGRIDWILVGGSIEVPSVATIIHSVADRYPSDHYPVLATLKVQPR
jgi:endonuclease/exonuclease/phosphatase family metal-dependent hydrolase